ncbi:unnamed protein product [Penicillium pancosmium]
MAKKKGNKGANAQKSARDMQTPVSDHERSDDSDTDKAKSNNTNEADSSQTTSLINTTTRSGSQDAEASKDKEPQPETKKNEKSKEPVRKARFDRSPTREGDFAPNAGDHESNDDEGSDLYDASDQDALEEHQIDPLSGWVKDLIQKETSIQSATMVEEFFTSDRPRYEECQQFFQQLNQKIRGANEQNHVNDVDIGTIPELGYNGLCETWQQKANIAVENKSVQDFWNAFNNTHKLLKIFNERHFLPQAWNISQDWAQEWVGAPNPTPVEDPSSTSTIANGQSSSTSQKISNGELSEASDYNTQTNAKTGLDALEARTIKQQRQLRSAEVLFWWPKGTGSQTFVRYGGKTPIYRIRAGSHEIYDKKQTQRVLTTQTRGTAKVSETKGGLPEERWAYTRDDVEDIIGIGWKIEDDDEEGFDPIDLLRPAKGAIYPHTRALVTWKDGIASLEGRAFIRRITTGSALDGDRVIYQKANEHEIAYRKKYGLEVYNDNAYDDRDPDTESDSTVNSRRSRNRRHHSKPTRSSKSTKKSRHQSQYETSDSSDTESDSSSQAHSSHRRRNRSEPVSRQKPAQLERSDKALIKKLEREIQMLKREAQSATEDSTTRRASRAH